ncbi:MAG: hypothetical protein K5886_12935 [Lachnospiraceae bacterium]|nr:hypothetical protein [Lachnospiraceae bacterium]
MLNEERIRLMTKMAAYETGEGRKDVSISHYFRGDYISFQLWKSAIYATAGFLIYVAMTILYDLETFLEEFYRMDLVAYFKDLLTKYAAVTGIYLVFSYFVYLYKYNKCKTHLKRYVRALNQLYNMYGVKARRK